MTEKEIEFYIRHIMDIKSKWLEFNPRLSGFTGKTFQFEVWTEGKTYFLGEIKWFGAWRRYTFFPVDRTVFEWECQRTIADVCEKMTKDHNKKYQIKHDLQGDVAYRLAEKILRLQQALDQANKNAKKQGMLGVLPQNGPPSFNEAKSYHSKVRNIVKETYG